MTKRSRCGLKRWHCRVGAGWVGGSHGCLAEAAAGQRLPCGDSDGSVDFPWLETGAVGEKPQVRQRVVGRLNIARLRSANLKMELWPLSHYLHSFGEFDLDLRHRVRLCEG